MIGVLVDSSVWIEHFRHGVHTLQQLLPADQVWTHPFVLGELACGTPPQRKPSLQLVSLQQPSQQPTLKEVLDFIEREALYGLGCGIVDLTLLTAALMTPGLKLWTLDRRLAALAQRFGVAYEPAVH